MFTPQRQAARNSCRCCEPNRPINSRSATGRGGRDAIFQARRQPAAARGASHPRRSSWTGTAGAAGAPSPNRSGRYERADRGSSRMTAGAVRRELPPFKHGGDAGEGEVGHHAQQFAGHLLRPVDQPLPGLRARLRLLLRAADPRLYGPVAGARLRVEAVREGGRGGSCWSASSARRAIRRAPSPSAPTPTPTSRSSASTA